MSNIKHTTCSPTTIPTRPCITGWPFPPFIEIDHYRGSFASTQAVWMAGDRADLDRPYEVRHTGPEPLDIVLFGQAFAATPPNITLGAGGRLSLVGNVISSFGRCLAINATPAIQQYCQSVGEVPSRCMFADQETERASQLAGEAFDHLRTLGEWDLYLNFVERGAVGFF
jgi:hypothetical protein